MWSLMYPIYLTSRLDGVCLNASNDEARGFPKVQGHSALNNKYQDNQDYIVRIFSKLTSEKQKKSVLFWASFRRAVVLCQCLNHLSCFCGKILCQKQFKERVYFGSWFKGRVHHGREIKEAEI